MLQNHPHALEKTLDWFPGTVTSVGRYVFFLGGHDLEMVAIRELLEQTGAHFEDANLSWGAKASAYSDRIRACLQQGRTPVLVELEDDLGLGPRALVVDHHGPCAGSDQPTSIEQVFSLLGLPPQAWTRWHQLVAANDRGYIPALREAGASDAEIVEIRAADRAAQGVTPAEEEAAARAVDAAELLAGGRLTVVRLPHDRTSPVSDLLQPELGGRGFENLFIVTPRSTNFYGSGRLVVRLAERFPGGWSGGALPERGFWGMNGYDAEVEQFLVAQLTEAACKRDEGRET